MHIYGPRLRTPLKTFHTDKAAPLDSGRPVSNQTGNISLFEKGTPASEIGPR